MHNDFTITIESKDEIIIVEIECVHGLADAREILREKYPFDEWRIVNIAAVPVADTHFRAVG